MIASSGKGAAQVPTGLIMVFGLVYLLMGIFMFWLSFKLFSYGSAIGVLRVTGSIQHLELALDRQRSYWKAVGIMVLIVICLYLVAIVVLLGFGATMGSRIQESLEKQRSTMHSSPAKDTESADESTETTPPEDETETK